MAEIEHTAENDAGCGDRGGPPGIGACTRDKGHGGRHGYAGVFWTSDANDAESSEAAKRLTTYAMLGASLFPVQCAGCHKANPSDVHLATCADLRRCMSEPVEFTRVEHDHSTANACRRTCPAYSEMLMEKTAARFNVPQTQNDRGEWVPAIPEPLYVGFRLRKSRCDCGQTFRSVQRYREHYALAHVLGLTR